MSTTHLNVGRTRFSQKRQNKRILVSPPRFPRKLGALTFPFCTFYISGHSRNKLARTIQAKDKEKNRIMNSLTIKMNWHYGK